MPYTADPTPMRCPTFGTPAYQQCDCEVCEPADLIRARRYSAIRVNPPQPDPSVRRCPHGTPEGIPCPRCMGPGNPYGTLGFDASPPPAIDWHAEIRDTLGDAAVLLDRVEHDPAALYGLLGRLINATTTILDDSKALAARVAALEAR